MKKIALLLAPIALLAGCATTDYNSPYGSTYNYGSGYDYGYRPTNNYHGHYGTVSNVRYVEDQGIGAGAVVGSIVGGLVGNQIGDGSGRTAATVGGAVVGGVIGHKIDQNRSGSYKQAVDVRLDGGGTVTIIQNNTVRFYNGQRVRILGTGNSVRLVTEGQYDYRY